MHAIVRYVADRGGEPAINRLLSRAGRSEDADAFLDKRRWWSFDTKISLFEAAADVLGDHDVSLRVAEAVLHHSVAPRSGWRCP